MDAELSLIHISFKYTYGNIKFYEFNIDIWVFILWRQNHLFKLHAIHRIYL